MRIISLLRLIYLMAYQHLCGLIPKIIITIFNVPLHFFELHFYFSIIICLQLYDTRINNLQLYSFKYSYLILIIHTQLYCLK